MKWVLDLLARYPWCLRELIRLALGVHNFCYWFVSRASQRLESSQLHPKHRIMRYHEWFVSRLEPGQRVLDLGCGNGALLEDMARKVGAQNAFGIDLDPRNVDIARRRVPGAHLTTGDGTSHKWNEKFHAVVLSNVLEHLEERVCFLSGLHSMSDRILVRVPLLDRDWIVPYKREMGIEHRLDATHQIEYTAEGFEKEVRDGGWSIQEDAVRFGELFVVLAPSRRAGE
ncbi:MAG: class I SAM-dependent methyltransferase [Bdellovibrionales bacterium]|nr:class I SAM-dependent methyltransferase [Bdellovibrionales bacterium]